MRIQLEIYLARFRDKKQVFEIDIPHIVWYTI